MKQLAQLLSPHSLASREKLSSLWETVGKTANQNRNLQITSRTLQLINQLSTESGLSNKRLVSKLVTWFRQLGTSAHDRDLRQMVYDVKDVDSDEEEPETTDVIESLRLMRREIARIEQIENARRRPR